MPAGILPATIINNKLYFLFGKENRFEKSAPGYSDFGGGSEKNESYLKTAIRESVEELTGFLGNEKDIKKLLSKYGTFNIDNQISEKKMYRTHIFPMKYDPNFTFYFNNNQSFIQKKLNPQVIKSTKIFEKQHIKWICIDDLLKKKKEFRHFYMDCIHLILENRESINDFVFKALTERSSKNKKKKNRN